MKKSHFGEKFASLLAIVSLFTGCAAIYRSGFVEIPHQPISGPVEIKSEWVEITPPEPLKPFGTSQYIDLELNDYKKSDFKTNENDENILELADGKTTSIEANLFDDKGKTYELKVNQTSAGPELVRKGKVKWSGEPNFSEPDYSDVDFPSDRVFTKLKIRSEVPLKCNKIEWVGRNPK